MIIYKGYKNLNLNNPVVTLGYFDGVHKGHRFLLDRVVSRAIESGGDSVVVTFYPHPRNVLSGNNSDMTFLSSMEEKITLLEEAGIDILVIVPFTHEFSNKEACDFIKEVLVDSVNMKYLIVGFNHHFGRGRGGDYSTISKCAAEFGFQLERVQGVSSEEGNISSTAIRVALLNGELEKANNLLGYSYFMNGKIVEGKKLGREIGFPTANIKPDYLNKLIPKSGVYAVEVLLDNKKYKGMLNIGNRPTVNPGHDPMSIEVHLFDFDDRIYGRNIRLIFRYRMRDEVRFENTDLLKEQLQKDKEIAIKLLE